MIDFNRHIVIEQYLKGQLSGVELQDFEQKLATDAALKKEVELQKAANNLITGSAGLDIKAKLQKIHNDSKATENTEAENRKENDEVPKGNNTEKSARSSESVAQRKWLWIVLLAVASGAAVYYLAKDDSDRSPNKEIIEVDQGEKSISQQEGELHLSDSVVILDQENVKDIDQEEGEPETNIIEENSASSKGSNSNVVASDPNDKGIEEVNSDQNIHDEIAETISSNDHENLQNIHGEVDHEQNIDNVDSVHSPENDPKTDPCQEVGSLKPDFKIEAPCFGSKEGKISLLNRGSHNFVNYSIDGGTSFVSEHEVLSLDVGTYNVLAQDEQECLTNPIAVQVKYDNCDYVIHHSNYQYFELNIATAHSILKFEVRNARTGVVVYTEVFEHRSQITYDGKDNNGVDLPVGNYVFVFTDQDNSYISRGEITVIK